MEYKIKELDGTWSIMVGKSLTYKYFDIRVVERVVLELNNMGYTQSA